MSEATAEPEHAAAHIAATALVARGHSVGTCPNCAAPTIGAYCTVCGQERDTHRRSVLGLLHDFFEDMLNFDSRIVRTVIALLVEPGEIAIAFREGRTRRFVPALRLYFFVSLVFFLLLSATNLAIIQLELVATKAKVFHDAKGNSYYLNPAYDPDDSDQKTLPKLIPIKKGAKGDEPHYNISTRAYFFAPIGSHHTVLPASVISKLRDDALGLNVQTKPLDPKNAKQQAEAKKVKSWLETHIFGGLQRLASNPAAMNEPLTTWIPRALFLLMPLYALLLAAFYWRQRKNYYFVDHLIFSLTVHAFTFVTLIGAAVLAQFLSGETVAWLLFIAIGIYIFIGMKRFYGQGWTITTLKFGTVSFIYTCFFLLPALGGILLLGFIGDPFG